MPEVNPIDSRYFLESDEYAEIESELVGAFDDRFKDETGIFAAWIGSQHPYADLIRTQEEAKLGISKYVSPRVEKISRFLALADNRPENHRIIHGFRISGTGLFTSDVEFVDQSGSDETTNLIMVDEIIGSEQGVTAESFRNYFKSRGADLDECVTVESNMRIGDRVRTGLGIATADLGYISLFNLIEGMRSQGSGESFVFAYLNRPAKVSFARAHIAYEPFMGNSELKTPKGKKGEFDPDFTPVQIPYHSNAEIFHAITPFAAKELHFGL